MKKIFLSMLALGLLFSCDPETITYEGDNFVAFTDSANDAISYTERSGGTTLTVGIAYPQATATVVNLSTTDGTAVNGTNYTLPTSVTIPAGQTFTSFTISSDDDSEVNTSRTFTLEISSVSADNVAIGFGDTGSHTKEVTIVNDDYDCTSEFEYWIGNLSTQNSNSGTGTGVGGTNALDECNLLVISQNDLAAWAESGYAGDEYTTQFTLQFIATNAEGTEGGVILQSTLIESEFASTSIGALDAYLSGSGTFNTSTGVIDLSYSVDLYYTASGDSYGTFYTGTATIEYAE